MVDDDDTSAVVTATETVYMNPCDDCDADRGALIFVVVSADTDPTFATAIVATAANAAIPRLFSDIFLLVRTVVMTRVVKNRASNAKVADL